MINKAINYFYHRWRKRKERKSSTPHLDDFLERRRNHVTNVTINDEVVIVNGRKLKPGTPEYKRAKRVASEGLNAGMKGLEAGMSALDLSMKSMDKTFKDMFK